VVGIPLLLFLLHPEYFTMLKSPKKIEAFFLEYKGQSAIVYVAFQIIQVIVTVIPGQVIQVAAGYLFGFFIALLLSVLGIGIGTIISFYLGRLLGRDFFVKKMGIYRYEKYDALLESDKGKIAIFILYFIPGLPKDIITYLAGISKMKLTPFFLLSMAGRLPALIASIFIGNFVLNSQWIGLIIVGSIVVVAVVVIFLFRNKIKEYLFRRK
jgi:uncharacterized membrane protein YdjX (TVP38/TMEM64 family)